MWHVIESCIGQPLYRQSVKQPTEKIWGQLSSLQFFYQEKKWCEASNQLTFDPANELIKENDQEKVEQAPNKLAQEIKEPVDSTREEIEGAKIHRISQAGDVELINGIANTSSRAGKQCDYEEEWSSQHSNVENSQEKWLLQSRTLVMTVYNSHTTLDTWGQKIAIAHIIICHMHKHSVRITYVQLKLYVRSNFMQN